MKVMLAPSGLATEVDNGALAFVSPGVASAAGFAGSVSPFLDSGSADLVSD